MDILGGKNFDEPPEISSIKKYVMDEFGVSVNVQIRQRDIVVIVPNSSLAGSLRLRGPEIKRRCQLTKRLTFRIA
jgi:hypothetical protein